MTDRPLSIAFFDPAHSLSGTLREGLTLLFDSTAATTLPDGPEVERAVDGSVRARLGERVALELTPVTEPLELPGSLTTLCRVVGTVDGRPVDCLGTTSETTEPPAWSELDAVRAVSALFSADTAVLAVARRPRGAAGHGEEAVAARLLVEGVLHDVEDARLSTVYDGDGRQRSAGLELWLPEEDFPRRLSGTVAAGASLTLEGLHVHAAVFAWKMEGRDGSGAYELAVRERREAA